MPGPGIRSNPTGNAARGQTGSTEARWSSLRSPNPNLREIDRRTIGGSNTHVPSESFRKSPIPKSVSRSRISGANADSGATIEHDARGGPIPIGASGDRRG